MNYELVTVRDNVYNFYYEQGVYDIGEIIRLAGNSFITVTDEDEQELYLKASEVITIRKM